MLAFFGKFGVLTKWKISWKKQISQIGSVKIGFNKSTRMNGMLNDQIYLI